MNSSCACTDGDNGDSGINLDVQINPLFVLPTERPPAVLDAIRRKRIAKCRDVPSQFGLCFKRVRLSRVFIFNRDLPYPVKK